MKNYKLRTISSALVCAVLLAACTSNTGVESVPSDTATTLPDSQSDYALETVDLSDQSVETVYGSQLPQYLNHQYYFEGEPVSMTESNFYFIDTYTELTQYAGYYYPSTSEGFIDLSAPIDSTGATDEMSEYSTYGDFFVAYAEQMIESSCIINKLAAEEGLTLPDDMSAQIDSIMSNIETSGAAAAGLTVDEYLSIYYGEGTTEESFRQTVYNYYMADVYTQEFIDNYEFDESEITVPNIRYALYEAFPGSTEEQIAAAEEAANALYESADGDVDTFTVEGALAYTNGEVADYGEIGVPNDGSIDEVFTQWAWDETRQENDLAVIHSDNFGYFVVAYIGTTEIDQASKDQLAVQKLSELISEAINNGDYDFYTSDPYAPAPTVVPLAEVVADEIFPQESTEATDASTTNVGGLTGSKGLDILLIALSVVGGVAVIGLAAMGVMSLTKKKEHSGKNEKEEEKSDGDN